MDTDQVIDYVKEASLLEQFMYELDRLNRIDRWLRWDHDSPYRPRFTTTEYKELSERSQTPWLDLVVTGVVQNLFIDGYRRPTDKDQASGWKAWQANGMDGRQIPINRATVGYGSSYMTILPGKMALTEEPMAVMRGKSPRNMLGFYSDPANDQWPVVALEVVRVKTGRYTCTLYDDQNLHTFSIDQSWDRPSEVDTLVHGIGVCPVQRFYNKIDLEGRTDGEVEPYISTAARIDQTTFDRLIVQRFASWVIRTVAGMSINETVGTTGETPDAAKMRLKVEDLLVAEDKDTKFGTLAATPLDGFITAQESDIKALAAVSQTPAHELLGSMANMSAEALAAAKAGQTAKVDERKHTLGEQYESAIRLACWINGDEDGYRDVSAQVRWKDTEIRSLAQAADALGKMATMLGFPVEILWEKIPGMTDQDVARAKLLFNSEDGLSKIVRELTNGQTPPAAA